MSDATASGQAQPQEFEKVLSDSDTSVASFETHKQDADRDRRSISFIPIRRRCR